MIIMKSKKVKRKYQIKNVCEVDDCERQPVFFIFSIGYICNVHFNELKKEEIEKNEDDE